MFYCHNNRPALNVTSFYLRRKTIIRTQQQVTAGSSDAIFGSVNWGSCPHNGQRKDVSLPGQVGKWLLLEGFGQAAMRAGKLGHGGEFWVLAANMDLAQV